MYMQRLAHYSPVTLEYVKAEKIAGQPDALIMQNEAERLLKKTAPQDFIIALDKNGVGYTSEEFARFFEQKMLHGSKAIAFLIGGPLGLAPEALKKADMQLSLSAMTFAHELALTLLLEQLYRAFTIIRGEKYHK